MRLLLGPSALLALHGAAAHADVHRAKFTTPSAYLVVEVLDDDLVHFELSALGDGPSVDRPLYTSPMVLRTDYGGPSTLTAEGNVIETAGMRLEVDPANLCVTVRDRAEDGAYLTTLCPADLHMPFKGLNIDPAATQHIYGLGQEFKNLGSANGDWTALGVRQGLEFGNGFQGFQGAAVGNVQVPVMYAVGADGLNYGLFVDNVYRQRWDLAAFWWEARMFGDHLRFYVMTGPDLPDLRADYMELTGRPPVPPRKAFGLWVSEFGYDSWGEIDGLLAGLRDHGFPLDGFVLDLNWFGGLVPHSFMGRLDWDQDQTPPLATNPYDFSDPGARIAAFAADHVGLTAIEESYLANTTRTFTDMPPDLTAYRRTDGRCDPTRQDRPVIDVSGFWGVGRMIDWSDPAAGAWVHDERRFPNLTRPGVTAHWTDLGEPETFDRAACYEGVEAGKHEHADVHNLYNLLWNRAIWDGYVAKRDEDGDPDDNPRPFIVTRSGTAGTQRFGAAMWSGDIASSLESLATHANAQMHMSFSGIDYYGADIGGFRREVLPYNDRAGGYRGYEDELYTQWFANAAWLDVPVRPHTDNEFVRVDPPYATAPHLVGHVASNLANIRQRYELIPYYYSLAWRAHLFGEPVVPPPAFHHQDDPALRRVGHQKMIGRDLMVGIVARHGEYERDVYLPAGKWANYHTNEWVTGAGGPVEDVPVYRDGLLRLPTFARAGAILPRMHVDGATKDAFGHRRDGAGRDELIVRVYAGPEPSAFTLYEDDGRTLRYDADGRPVYHHRTTELGQRRLDDGAIEVTVDPAVDVNGDGPFEGAVTERPNVIELVVEDAAATAVRLNGADLAGHATRTAFEAAESGWLNAGRNLILAKSGPMDVYGGPARTFTFELQPVAPAASVNFVCDRGFTVPGESVYAVGSLPALGGWDPARAVKLEPGVYHEYIVNPPPGHQGPGPSAPVWTGVIADLPPDTAFEWKCIRRREDGTGTVRWQPDPNSAHATGASGYAGRSYGSF